MKTNRNYLKIGILLSLLITMVLSCTNDNLELSTNNQIQQKQKNSIRKVTINEVPSIRKYLKSNISSNQKSSGNSSYAVTPFGNIPLDNITEVLDTLGNANYTFPIIPSNLQKDKFFNLVIHQNTEQGTSNSYVVEYKMESDFATGYANGTKDFNQFTGKIKKYNTETFLANPPPPTPCDEEEEDEDILPPCLEIVIENGDDYNDVGDDPSGDGTTNTGSNSNGGFGDSSSDGTSTSTGGSGAVTCWTELIASPCNGNGMHYGESYCQGSFQGSILLVTTCSDGYGYTVDLSHKTSDCDDGSGDVAVIPTIFSKFDTIVLGLDENEQECLNQNCDLKNDLYQYLNSNVDSNGNYEQDAVDFAQYVTSLIDSNCNFNAEVDFEEQIILDTTFSNNQKVKCIYDKLKNMSATIFNDIAIDNFDSNSTKKLKFEIGNLAAGSTEWARTMIRYDPNNSSPLWSGNVITIRLNHSIINSLSSIEIALLLIHESIHAELLSRCIDLGIIAYSDSTGLTLFNSNGTVNSYLLSDIIFNQMMINYINPSQPNPEWNHNAFNGFNYRLSITQDLVNIHQYINDTANDFLTNINNDVNCVGCPYTINQVMQNLSWIGLESTTDYNNISNNSILLNKKLWIESKAHSVYNQNCN